MIGKLLDQESDQINASNFFSLQMALAYALVTRCDLAVYLLAFQRIASAHVRPPQEIEHENEMGSDVSS